MALIVFIFISKILKGKKAKKKEKAKDRIWIEGNMLSYTMIKQWNEHIPKSNFPPIRLPIIVIMEADFMILRLQQQQSVVKYY